MLVIMDFKYGIITRTRKNPYSRVEVIFLFTGEIQNEIGKNRRDQIYDLGAGQLAVTRVKIVDAYKRGYKTT